MRCLSIMVIMFFAILLAVSVNAQMYEYRDSDGNMRYTDDLGKVPAHSRESAGRINVVPRSYSPYETQDASPDSDETRSASSEQIDPDLVAAGKALQEEQDALLEEYESLQKAIAEAGDPPGPSASEDELAAYNRKVEKSNRRIADYNKKLEDLEKRVQKHNVRFKQ